MSILNIVEGVLTLVLTQDREEDTKKKENTDTRDQDQGVEVIEIERKNLDTERGAEHPKSHEKLWIVLKEELW